MNQALLIVFSCRAKCKPDPQFYGFSAHREKGWVGENGGQVAGEYERQRGGKDTEIFTKGLCQV